MEKSIQNAILGYVPKEVKGQGFLMEEGWHPVTVKSWQPTHSFLNWDGGMKDAARLPEFKDPAPELGVVFQAEGGVVLLRAHTKGYKTWEDLSDEDRESGKYVKVPFHDKVYACLEDKKGNLVRVKDSSRTADAENFIDQLFTSAGVTGVNIGEAMDKIQGEKIQLMVNVKIDEYVEGQPQAKIIGFRKYRGEQVASNDEDFGG